jgi:catechol 2,3-dioxygenase-like lactoylglutathione lyase family enzyme
MFDHVTIRAEDRVASERFYRTVLATLGIKATRVDEELVGWREFAIIGATPGHPPTRHLHVAFVAPSREHVDTFWRTGVEAGYEDAGPPGERPQYKPDYYGAFVLDPDGNSVEAVHHDDIRWGNHIDHVWIGVPDVDAAATFYATIARHTGLRAGARWDHGRQFQGAWATFSLVGDDRPVTENLHLAFPALDRQTVDDFHAAATTSGYRSNGEPGERPWYHPGYYAAFIFDPNGINVESVHRGSD